MFYRFLIRQASEYELMHCAQIRYILTNKDNKFITMPKLYRACLGINEGYRFYSFWTQQQVYSLFIFIGINIIAAGIKQEGAVIMGRLEWIKKIIIIVVGSIVAAY